MATPIPSNLAEFTVAEIAFATRGETSADPGLSVRGVSTDSRAVRPGELFVALVGARFDGHTHLEVALARGAAAALVSRLQKGVPIAQIVVADTERALGDLAGAYARRWRSRRPERRIIAVTGSAGKTTTRGVLTHVLGALGSSVHSSEGNLNNLIGLPMTLFGLTSEHDLAVVEMGMNSVGEIARLAEIAAPDLGVVTLVAPAHTEGVGSLSGVLREKSALLAALPPDGVAIVEMSDPMTRASLVASRARHAVTYGPHPDAIVGLEERETRGLSGSRLVVSLRTREPRRLTLDVPLLGDAGARAALAAVATALALRPNRTDWDRVRDAVASLPQGEPGRLGVRTFGRELTVIDDAYNANPASMTASIGAAREIADGLHRPLSLILGAMFELGEASDALHREVALRAVEAQPSWVLVVGERARPMLEVLEAHRVSHRFARDAEEAGAAISGLEGQVVLIKASNSLGLSALVARFPPKEPAC